MRFHLVFSYEQAMVSNLDILLLLDKSKHCVITVRFNVSIEDNIHSKVNSNYNKLTELLIVDGDQEYDNYPVM